MYRTPLILPSCSEHIRICNSAFGERGIFGIFYKGAAKNVILTGFYGIAGRGGKSNNAAQAVKEEVIIMMPAWQAARLTKTAAAL